jgi:hypothetical protein
MAMQRPRTYPDRMNDPWTNLVEMLAGQRRASPSSWPARRVHRMMDDATMQPRKRSTEPPRPLPPLRPLYRPG